MWTAFLYQSGGHRSFELKGLSGFKALEGNGGEGGIRTPDGLAPMPHFECGAFNHSATSPRGAWAVAGAGAHIAIVAACDKSKLDEVFFRLT